MTNTPQRSTFVTVVACIFIVLSGFATNIAILQNVMIQTVFRGPEMEGALQALSPDAPQISVFMFRHLGLIALAFLLVSVGVLVISIGLLKRWNWARLCFAGVMVLGIVWNLLSVGMQLFTFSSMQHAMQQQMQNAPGMPDMSFMYGAISVVSAVFAIGFSVLFGWIAKRLLSAPIAAEFRQQSLPAQ